MGKVPWFLPILCSNQVCGLWTMVRRPRTCYLYWCGAAFSSLVKRKQLPTQSAMRIIASLFMSLHLKLSFNVSRARVLWDWQMFKGAYGGPLFMEITDMGHALVLFLFCQCLPVFASVPLHLNSSPWKACLAHRRVMLFNQQPLFLEAAWSWRVLLVKYAFCSLTLRLLSALWELCIAPVKPASFFFYWFHPTCGVSSLKLRESLFYSCQSGYILSLVTTHGCVSKERQELQWESLHQNCYVLFA